MFAGEQPVCSDLEWLLQGSKAVNHLWLDPELTVHGHLAKASSKQRIVFNGGNVTAKTLQQRNEHRILCSFVISSDSCRMNASGRQAVASTRCLPAVHPLRTSGKPPSISLAEVNEQTSRPIAHPLYRRPILFCYEELCLFNFVFVHQ